MPIKKPIPTYKIFTAALLLTLLFGSAGLAWAQNPAPEPVAEVPPSNPAMTGYFVYDERSGTFHTYGSRYNFRLRPGGVTILLPSESAEVQFLGANPGARLSGRNRVRARANYFVGNDPSQWRRNAPMYAQVVYDELYPGIDLVYTLRNGQLKSDLHVSPGADLSRVRIRYSGHASLALREGVLDVRLPSGEALREEIPAAYQEIGGQRRQVRVAFRLLDDATYTFALRGRYDPAYPLVIDPVLTYSTYLGGSAQDEAWAVAVDGDGAIHVTGITQSVDFPATEPGQHAVGKDVFVAKIGPGGELLYVSIFGGESGEEGNAIAVDELGNAYVGGETFSTNFPILNAWQPYFAGYEEAFVLKVDERGDLVYSTFFGGLRAEEVNDMVADSVGNLYLGGEVYSDDFPLIDPWSDAVFGLGDEDVFITIFNAHGEMVYSTYVSAEHRDQVFRIAVDREGYVYGTGMTSSATFPLVNPFQSTYGGDWDDCFVFKLDPWTNTMIYSTLLGGSGRDECWGLAVDDEGAAYVTGFTTSPDFPVANALEPEHNGYYDAFVAKLSPEGNRLLFSTFLGGIGKDSAWGLDLDGEANVYVTGETYSPDFPLLDPLQPDYRGEQEAFLTILTSEGELKYSSFLGGSANDRGWRLVVDENWIVYVVGSTDSADFPLAAPHQTHHAGEADAFVSTWEGLVPTPTPTPTPTPIPTATPTPTPTPHASAEIGPEGGSLWLSYPQHLTLLQVPPGAVSTLTTFKLVYEGRPDPQGELQGLNHFFTLAVQPPHNVDRPLHLTLGYEETRGAIAETISLYRLEDNAWVTGGITIEAQSTLQMGQVLAWVKEPGIYALLGRTNRLYLPLALRRE